MRLGTAYSSRSRIIAEVTLMTGRLSTWERKIVT